MRYKLLVLLLALLCFTVLFGCIQPSDSSDEQEKPTPTAEPKKEFYIGYKFRENEALFHRLRIETTVDANKKPTQILETVTIPLAVYPDYAHIRMVMLKALRLDKNGASDICGELAYSQKLSDMNLYVDGKVDYGHFSVTNFYLPQRPLRIGDSWTFEGINYSLEEATTIETLAGKFKVLRISFSGQRSAASGTKSIEGTLFFDYENNRIAKYVQEEKRKGYRRTIETELIGVKQDYDEPDMRCVYAQTKLSLLAKYEKARAQNAVENFKESLYFALSAKYELKGKDLNADEKQLYANILEIIADDYKWLNEQKKELATRLELGRLYIEMFNEALASGLANARHYFGARYNLQAVADSNSMYADEANEMLQALDESEFGIVRGKALLKDTGDNTGTIAELFDKTTVLQFELLGEPYYNLPVMDKSSEDELAICLYRDGYTPKFLIGSAGRLVSKHHDIILEPLLDSNAAVIAGTCYNERGFVQNAKLTLQSSSESAEVVCDKYFVATLKPGDYNITCNGKTLAENIPLKAGKVVIKHLKLSENN
ncbi:MAG: hypothetical protein J7L44_01880 [Candidatus Diapherotrites archaeon]|nr:hypothetical protein [Candidatus Diapherotrites archaeon]